MTVAVRGLRELVAATDAAGREVRRDLNGELRKVAEPVRQDAESFAKTRIRRNTPKWSLMRTGVTRRVVYVAPRARGVGSRGLVQYRRPNFGRLLMDRAMQPALDRHEHEIEQQVGRFLDEVGRRWDG